MNRLNDVNNNNNNFAEVNEANSNKRKTFPQEDNISEMGKKLLKLSNELDRIDSKKTENYKIQGSFKDEIRKIEKEEDILLKALEIINNKKYIFEYFADYEKEYNIFMQCIRNELNLPIHDLTSACVYLQLAYKIGENNENKKIIKEIDDFFRNHLVSENTKNLKSDECFIVVNFEAQRFDIAVLSEFSAYFKATFENFKSNQSFEILTTPLLEENPTFVFNILETCQKEKNRTWGWNGAKFLQDLSVEEILTYYKILTYLQIDLNLIKDVKAFLLNKFKKSYLDYLPLINQDHEICLDLEFKRKILNYLLNLDFEEIHKSQATCQFIKNNIHCLNQIELSQQEDINDEKDIIFFKDWLHFLSKNQLQATSLALNYHETCINLNALGDLCAQGEEKEYLSGFKVDNDQVDVLMDVIVKCPSLKHINIKLDGIQAEEFFNALQLKLESEKNTHHLDHLELYWTPSIAYSSDYDDEDKKKLFEWKRSV